ncbi:MAG: hypothetical protein U0361_23065 [Nitrospiraceae bacterium]
MAATNRPEILDPALLRAGRFDRQARRRPDKIGRLAILKVHAKTITLANEGDLDTIAAMTPGFVGADLANLLNEAALLAVRWGKDTVSLSELQEAVRSSSQDSKRRTECSIRWKGTGRAPRGRPCVGGARRAGRGCGPENLDYPARHRRTRLYPATPTEDRFLMTASNCATRSQSSRRAAEDIIYGEVSTGSAGRFAQGHRYRQEHGEGLRDGEKLGQVSLERDRQSPFLQSMPGQTPADYSEQTSREIDCEVRQLIDDQYARVRDIIQRQESSPQGGAGLAGKGNHHRRRTQRCCHPPSLAPTAAISSILSESL